MRQTKTLFVAAFALLLLPLLLPAQMENQRTNTVRLEATLSPSNENPPIQDRQGSAHVEVLFRLTRELNDTNDDGVIDDDDDNVFEDFFGFVSDPFTDDDDDNGSTPNPIQSATVEFRVMNLNVGQEETLTNMHVHRGRAGSNGPVVVDSAFGDPVPAMAGGGMSLTRSRQITNMTELDVVREIMRNPSDFYVNIHSESYPGGIVRGQLRRSSEDESGLTNQRLLTIQQQIMDLQAAVEEIEGSVGGSDTAIIMEGVQRLLERNGLTRIRESDVVDVPVQ